jgi:hypothetical protein
MRDEKIAREVKVEITYTEFEGGGRMLLEKVVGDEDATVPEVIRLWIAQSYLQELISCRSESPELLTEGK